MWKSPINGKSFPVDHKIKSRHTANGILKQASCPRHSTSVWRVNPVTGHRPFNVLTEDFSLERKACVSARVTQLKADMPLSENLTPLPTSRAAHGKP
ncbi:MAG TPA: hypothetical protein VN838_13010, partial [Bradyrhizobium sp.]|nr:hypothetical protein [Bradyrhizobium sp.]